MAGNGAWLVLVEGRFGEAVAARLTQTRDRVHVERVLSALPSLEAALDDVDFVAVVTWRPYPAALDTVDAACAGRIPWSGVTLAGRCLVTGPLVVPGGPCYDCYRKRLWSHLAHPERQHALEAALDADDNLGCAGFPPGSVAVATAALALDRAETGTGAGRVRRLDLVHGDMTQSQVVRVHGCTRCGHDEAGVRYVSRLRAAWGVDHQ